MLVSTVFVAFATLVHSVSSTMKDAQFARAAANLVYSDHLLFDSPARSKLSCLELCAVTKCCVRFTYTGRRGTPGRCRGHAAQLFPSDAGAITPGATNYVWTGLREISGVPGNVALYKEASQSSVTSGGSASLAVDGGLDTLYQRSFTCTHTQISDVVASWWQVDLGGDGLGFDVTSVIITNRGDGFGWRLRDFDVHVYTENPAANPSASGRLCSHYDGPMADGVTEEVACCYGPIRGRFVRVTNTPGEVLTLCEVQVMAVPVIQLEIET